MLLCQEMSVKAVYLKLFIDWTRMLLTRGSNWVIKVGRHPKDKKLITQWLFLKVTLIISSNIKLVTICIEQIFYLIKCCSNVTLVTNMRYDID